MKKQEKMLLVGGDIATPDAINYCKEFGVYTIMTNHIPYEENPFKQMADEAWDIPVEELDLLEEKCRKEGVTAVFAGVNEHNLDMTKALAERLGLPFYASDEAWACARDKGRFKEHCMAVGLDVPKRYNVKLPVTQEMLAEVKFPVIVKPVDSCGRQGVTICRSAEELAAAYQLALSFSGSGDIIVEDYVDGIEMDCMYVVLEGEPFITSACVKCCVNVNGAPTFSFCPTSAWHRDDFENRFGDKLRMLLKRIDCKYGYFSLQIMYKAGKYYLLEFAHRLDGTASWRLTKHQTGYSSLELHVDVQLSRDVKYWIPIVKNRTKSFAITVYILYCNPGKIKRIVGLDKLKNMEGVSITVDRFREGDEVAATGSMYQTAFFMHLKAKDEDGLVALVKKINETVHFYDENGKDMLCYLENFDILNGDTTH